MKEQDQIKAIAELDGWTFSDVSSWHEKWTDQNNIHYESAPPYLISRDAIVQVIEKQSNAKQAELVSNFICQERDNIDDMIALLTAAPTQLAEYLLRATGKWKE